MKGTISGLISLEATTPKHFNSILLATTPKKIGKITLNPLDKKKHYSTNETPSQQIVTLLRLKCIIQNNLRM